MVLRRLAGKTENAAPAMALLTQFGGGKTHTLTALYHLVKHPREVEAIDGVRTILEQADVDRIPPAKVAVFTDGFQIRHQPTLKKVVNDRRASLGEDGEIRRAVAARAFWKSQNGRAAPART